MFCPIVGMPDVVEDWGLGLMVGGIGCRFSDFGLRVSDVYTIGPSASACCWVGPRSLRFLMSEVPL